MSLQAFAWAEIVATLQDLKDGQPACIPQYDFVTSSRTSEPTPVESADVILFDGILAFYSAGEILPCAVSPHCQGRDCRSHPLSAQVTLSKGISAIMQQSKAGLSSSMQARSA